MQQQRPTRKSERRKVSIRSKAHTFFHFLCVCCATTFGIIFKHTQDRQCHSCEYLFAVCVCANRRSTERDIRYDFRTVRVCVCVLCACDSAHTLTSHMHARRRRRRRRRKRIRNVPVSRALSCHTFSASSNFFSSACVYSVGFGLCMFISEPTASHIVNKPPRRIPTG